MEGIIPKVNELQTQIEDLELEKYPKEVQEQFWNFFYNVPMIQNLTSEKRLRAKDLPRDSDGKIIVDVTNPHILEDMDYFRPAALYYRKHGRYTDLRPNPNPNSEYGKWIREEVRRCIDGYVRPSDGEWIPGDLYYFWNYSVMSIAKKVRKGDKKALRVIDFPSIWEGHYLKFHYLNQAREAGKHALELSRRGPHPYWEKILTPNGWKQFGDLKVGDYVFGDDGLPTEIIDIPFDGTDTIYELEFLDGRKVYAGSQHIFPLIHKGNLKLLKTEDIANNYYTKHNSRNNPTGIEYKYYTPLHRKIEFEEKVVPIDPYTFGLLLGDGCFRHPRSKQAYLTAHPTDWESYKNNIPYKSIRRKDGFTYVLEIPNFSDVLKEYNLDMKLSTEKHIPNCYMMNTEKVRRDVLAGLLDSDGWVQHNELMFCSSSKQLADDVIFIARSLGYNVNIHYKKNNYSGAWNVRIFTTDKLFKLERKNALLTDCNTKYGKSRCVKTSLVKVTMLGAEKCKCITVNNSSHQYLIGDFIVTHNSGKSFTAAALLARRFILGERKSFDEEEQKEKNRKNICYAAASDKKYLVAGDQTLDKFQFDIDFVADNTEWPRKRLTNTIKDMQWTLGYQDLDSGTKKGLLNSTIGVSMKDDESKLRGSRGILYIFEEAGSFNRLLEVWNNQLPSVEDGESVFGMLYGFGTAGDSQSDFYAMSEMMYHPEGYHVYGIRNVYDIDGKGGNTFTYFFPGYLNRANCYDENGNSDVTKALLEILLDRYKMKYNSTDINAVSKRTAEIPIVPQEAIIRSRGNVFPIAEINERLNELDSNKSSLDDVYIGKLNQKQNGEIEYEMTTDTPIRNFPLKDNKAHGAIEIYSMPEKDSNGKIVDYRYIASCDPVDKDEADSVSLCSIFVMDLFTDRIVAEYTGRQDYAEENYEILRRLCLFYNAQCLYENNITGTFAYFSKMRCTHLLADTPEYLKDKDLIKVSKIGNMSKGVTATKPINDYADRLIRDWLLLPKTIIETNANGEEVETQVYNLHFIKNRALLKELSLYNTDGNFDRIRSLGLLMIYREQFLIQYEGNINNRNNITDKDYIGNDDFFTRNYDKRFKSKGIDDSIKLI